MSLAVASDARVEALRSALPLLERKVHGKPLLYLDQAATSPKALPVLEAMDRYNRHGSANIHRGVHSLSLEASDAYDGARATVASFIGASDESEVIFTRGTTESINLVAHSWGGAHLASNDAIVLTEMEHHANIVPWQILQSRLGFEIRVVRVDDDGSLDLDHLAGLLDAKVKLVSFVWVSNALGTVNPAAAIVSLVRSRSSAVIVVDAAQAVTHFPLGVAKLGADFVAWSGHKLYGPTGIGVLWGRKALLDAMPPFLGGGDMIRSVSFEGTIFNDAPARFEAGTPPIAEAIGLGAACDFVESLGWDWIREREDELLRSALAALSEVPGLRILGNAPDRAALVSFTIEGMHPSDVGTLVDLDGVALRTGQHCTEPLHRRMGVTATARASFGPYHRLEDVATLKNALLRARRTAGLA